MSLIKMMENMFVVFYVFIFCIEVVFFFVSCGKMFMFLKIYMFYFEDCFLYYVCFYGCWFLKKCDDDEVFDRNLKFCVFKGLKIDFCKLFCCCKVICIWSLCDFVLLYQIYLC